MIKAVLFDLDGTLLPMDQDRFTAAYFRALCAFLAPRGYAPDRITASLKRGIAAMLGNDGHETNECAFWRAFTDCYGGDVCRKDFDDFYATAFEELKSVCGFDAAAKAVVAELKAQGYTLVLASNPVFPVCAHKSRMRWAGLDASDFALITAYENSHYCKPRSGYYAEIAHFLNCAPDECIMVGNDTGDDMPAERLGMKVFLLPKMLINNSGADISVYPQGDLADLPSFIKTIK